MSSADAVLVKKKSVAKKLAEKRGGKEAVKQRRQRLEALVAGRVGKKRVYHVEQNGAQVIRITVEV